MCLIIGKIRASVIYSSPSEESAVALAIADLVTDLCKVGATESRLESLPATRLKNAICIGSLENTDFERWAQENLDFEKGNWIEHEEGYSIQTIGDESDNLLIAGVTTRATVFAIYEFCEQYLGIDPFYYWTDTQPKTIESLVLKNVFVENWPKAYETRGWFINDEDMLSAWSGGKNAQHAGYPMKIMHPEVFEKILETALRCKQNLIIPATYHNIDLPENKRLFALAKARGLKISQHHQEPVGVSADIFEQYWKDRNEEVSANYLDNKDKYEIVWRHHIRKYLDIGADVVWQLGLRGKDDRPFWYGSENAPQNDDERGKVISDAIEHQWNVIKDETGHADFESTITLWMEGSDLHSKGFLKFPGKTIIVFSDFGPTQNLRQDFREVSRCEDRMYGVYYHVAFMSCGPHLAQGTHPEKIENNIGASVQMGDTAYAVLNVSNIREFVLGIDYASTLFWDADVPLDDWILKWCEFYYGVYAKQAEEVYRCFYGAYHLISNEPTIVDEEDMDFLDGMALKMGRKLLETMQSNDFLPDAMQNQRIYHFGSTASCADYYFKATEDSLTKWAACKTKADVLLPLLEESQRGFFVSNLQSQLYIIVGIYQWLNLICSAFLSNESERQGYLQSAITELQLLLANRDQIAQGKWAGWYNNERLFDIEAALNQTQYTRGSLR